MRASRDADALRGPVHAAGSAAAAPRAGWEARLALRFARVGARSVLAHRAHEGPLVVQKPLYPEGEGVCQCIVVHPPGGIAGGDRLALDVEVGAGAHAQLTTPGATKWYRGAGRDARQAILLRVQGAAVVEWLPQVTIVFDGAEARSSLDIALDADSIFAGWDVVCLGRTASAERFATGAWRQRIDIARSGAPVWSERMVLRGDDPLLSSPVGLNGAPVFGTFVAVAATIDNSLLAACRAVAPVQGDGTVTRLPGALVARYRGHASEAAHYYFSTLWSLLRPAVIGRSAVAPRIWST